MEDVLVPIFVIGIVVGAPIAAWVVTRVLAHQERMEMLKRGFVPPPDPHAMHRAAKFGMKSGWTPAPGAVPPPGWTPASYDPSYQAQAHLRKGVQVAFIGLALLIGLSFIGSHDGRYLFGPWLLGGLIPMFVGIAQIITAVMGGAQFGRLSGAQCGPPESSRTMGAPQAPTAPTGPPPPPSSYGGWRPGGTPEIEPPAGPLDRR
jgi:hypothetical protein